MVEAQRQVYQKRTLVVRYRTLDLCNFTLKTSKTAKRRSGIASVALLCNCDSLFELQWKELILLSAKRL
jgi:hypothetical protein